MLQSKPVIIPNESVDPGWGVTVAAEL
jgi:hypothetical protein